MQGVTATEQASPTAHLSRTVDDYKFRHENVATYWLSWADPGAEAAIRERTAATASAPAGEAGQVTARMQGAVPWSPWCECMFLVRMNVSAVEF